MLLKMKNVNFWHSTKKFDSILFYPFLLHYQWANFKLQGKSFCFNDIE